MRAGFGEVSGDPPDDATARWFAEIPTLTTDADLFRHIADQTVRDLLALRVQTRFDGHRVVLPAAGLPWFLTVFGRDTLITAYQSVAFGQQLARGALLELASLQGKESNDFKDEEPGRILHEIRQGELTRLGLKPHSPYYGTADATMLWLILLSEYWRWTGDGALVHRLAPNTRAALDWIDRYGDRDGDGYVEYQTRSSQGLGNQCWRDSPTGVQFADGRLPYLPVATCELQGYVYDAKLRVAELADGPLADPALATRLRAEAATLRRQFNVDFWVDERGGYYAVGLDGDKQQIDSMTSNMGHLLWSGIVDDDRVETVVAPPDVGRDVLRLGRADTVHSGPWVQPDRVPPRHGVAARQLADRVGSGPVRLPGGGQPDRPGPDRGGRRTPNYRLPEAFSGYARSVSRFPVPYPTACSPQAWATAAPLGFLRAMLGLDRGRRRAEPRPGRPRPGRAGSASAACRRSARAGICRPWAGPARWSGPAEPRARRFRSASVAKCGCPAGDRRPDSPLWNPIRSPTPVS